MQQVTRADRQYFCFLLSCALWCLVEQKICVCVMGSEMDQILDWTGLDIHRHRHRHRRRHRRRHRTKTRTRHRQVGRGVDGNGNCIWAGVGRVGRDVKKMMSMGSCLLAPGRPGCLGWLGLLLGGGEKAAVTVSSRAWAWCWWRTQQCQPSIQQVRRYNRVTRDQGR